jgi:transposase
VSAESRFTDAPVCERCEFHHDDAKPEHRHRDRDWLHEQYVTLEKSTYEIGAEFDISPSTIQKWLRKHDIESRSRNTIADERLRDESWLREQHFEQEMSHSDIAAECGVDRSVVTRWFNRHGINHRSQPDDRLHDAAWLRARYHDDELSQRDIADICNCHHTTVANWLDRHGIETRGRMEVVE